MLLNKRKNGKGGLSLGGIILLILLMKFINRFSGLFTLLVGVAFIALLFFFIRSVILSMKDNNSNKRETVDVKTYGTYPKTTVQHHSTSSSAAASKPASPPPQKQESSQQPKYSPEVQAVVDEGKRAHSELEHLYATIPNLSVKSQIRELIDVSDKIIQDAVEDPGDVPQIKKFLDYYLPTTIKLLNAYDRMGAQGIEGSNISGSMHSIEEMLDTAVAAYKKLLDSLFANQALDVETDIQVMNTLLKREGFANNGFPVNKYNSSSAAMTQKTKEEK